jgi:hypothetical protein
MMRLALPLVHGRNGLVTRCLRPSSDALPGSAFELKYLAFDLFGLASHFVLHAISSCRGIQRLAHELGRPGGVSPGGPAICLV